MQARFARFVGYVSALPAPPIEALLDVGDWLRRWGLKALGRSISQRVLTDRDKRAAFWGCVQITVAFLTTSMFPLVMLIVGPVLLGIPHVLADLRYLVARPGLHRRPLALGAIGVGVLAAGLGYGVRGGLVGAALALCVARTSWVRRCAGLFVVAALFVVAQRAGRLSDLAFAHLHNFVGILIWLAWRPRQTRWHLLPLSVFALGSFLVLSGLSAPLPAFTKGLEAPWTGLGMFELCQWLTPSPFDPNSVRLVLFYAFAQGAHYVVWLRLVPEDDRPSKSPRSYMQSYRALTSDLGSILMWLAVIGAFALIGWAMFAPSEARDGYLRLAFFHGHLELAAGALLWAEGRLGSGART